MPVRATFEERYARLAFPEPNSGCFIWTGSLDRNGYGRLGIGYSAEDNRRTTWAHRAAYEHFVGPIPDGLVIDHKCRMKCCVNPAHLEPVTQLENCRRGRAGEVVRARSVAQTHCKRGHILSGKNVQLYRGARLCLMCRGLRGEARKVARRGKS